MRSAVVFGLSKAGYRIYRVLRSLQLAVIVILSLAASLAAATFIESIYDTPTAQYYVYQTVWFYGVLTLLGVNILVVALSRLPWKKSHGPFLFAHLGILLLLFGAWMTAKFGLDGSMRISEGQSTGFVELSSTLLAVNDLGNVKLYSVPWIPPDTKFKPIEIPEFGLRVTKYLTHAEPQIAFKEPENPTEHGLYPAVKIIIKGGPMRITQEYWLWPGDPSLMQIQAGPARLAIWAPELLPADRKPQAPDKGHPFLLLTAHTDGSLEYSARDSSGEHVKTGKFLKGKAKGQVLDPGWRGGVSVTIAEYIPMAANDTGYVASQTQYGEQAPPSAVYVTTGNGVANSDIWLGLGDRAMLSHQGREIGVTYVPKRVLLPFNIRLEHFQIERYSGTNDPASYSSDVQVVDSKLPGQYGPKTTISMNEPLQHGGITFYQSSYEDAQPRPVTSIFSVNQDPGRKLKYFGSLFLVAGILWLFGVKYLKGKPKAAK